jgi:hypothetical protein
LFEFNGRTQVSQQISIWLKEQEMNAVEIEEAISALAEQSFEGGEFRSLSCKPSGTKKPQLKPAAPARPGVSNESRTSCPSI